jgi:hypothetical protein
MPDGASFFDPCFGYPPSLGSKLVRLPRSGERIATLTRKLALAEIWSLSGSSSAFRLASRASSIGSAGSGSSSTLSRIRVPVRWRVAKVGR